MKGLVLMLRTEDTLYTRRWECQGELSEERAVAYIILVLSSEEAAEHSTGADVSSPPWVKTLKS